MSEARPAVFLSYASQDAAVAGKIADALKAVGVEVWFDLAELRGGDAWDAKIRRQIKECTLFIPIISAQTQERLEGYFRLEWRLAEQRTHLMAKGKLFLLPVVVDDTNENNTHVPDAFMEVQWSRLQDSDAPTTFAQRVANLLKGGPAKASSAHKGTLLRDSAVSAGPVMASSIYGGSSVATLGTLISPSRAPAIPVAASPAKRSIAILPLLNMSEDKENTWFADGVHEDILTGLAKIRDLKVISRASVMGYRNTTQSPRQIATDLGVVYVLTGSVRRAGPRARVTVQLVEAATDEHV